MCNDKQASLSCSGKDDKLAMTELKEEKKQELGKVKTLYKRFSLSGEFE